MEEIQETHEERESTTSKSTETLPQAVIRFTGDSGDGMQLAGLKFTSASVIFGNDVSTFPEFPAEIRAPTGTLAGVSGFQIHFSSTKISTPGDDLDALIAMNPAALRVNIKDLKPNGIIIIDESTFTPKNLSKAGYSLNPLKDRSLDKYRVFSLDITKLNYEAVHKVEGLTNKQINLTRNFYTLGLLSWLYNRPLESTIEWIQDKFNKRPAIIEANTLALKAGYYYGETTELFSVQYQVPKAKMEPGLYRYISGNQALALGFVTAAQIVKKEVFYGAYPITPASDLLHDLVRYHGYGIRTFQAEDEIAAIGSIIGAAFGGVIGVTGTSGPGFALMSEALGLAVITELPIIVVNVQRAGPSTGMPTKTEQSDLLQGIYGRNGESPLPVLAPQSSGDCFYMAIEAIRIATKFMTPVLLLSDGYMANNIDPWKIPDINQIPSLKIDHPTKESFDIADHFLPYIRNENLARPWAIPGIKGLEHRIGGLEKEDKTGNVSYDPENHELMVKLRSEKIEKIAEDIPRQNIEGPAEGDLLVLSWGSTNGAVQIAAEKMRQQGYSVANTNLRYINPFPRNLEEIVQSYKKILIPELNRGQLKFLIQAKYSIETIGLNKTQGRPFLVKEIIEKIDSILNGDL
ncbi:2-oxoacid:acceptor oxidoreductase subunit alpha [Candidatus Hodarchaeum mangrovi]